MNIATVFSGIGAPEYALKTYFSSLHPSIVFACDCGEIRNNLSDTDAEKLFAIQNPVERQKAVKKAYEKLRKVHWIKATYFRNYESLGITDEKWYDDIRFIDGTLFRKKVDLFVGGSPCQSFSNMGHRAGLEDTRGTLFYDFARLVKEIQPKVFIYENVPGMLTHDHGHTWQVIQEVFDSLNYSYQVKVLNSADYGIPQNRKRLFVVGFKSKIYNDRFHFPKPFALQVTAKQFLQPNNEVAPSFYLREKGFEFVTTHRGRASINAAVIRTEKRNQQFNWNGDFVFVPYQEIADNSDILAHSYVGEYQGVLGVVRKMTPLECHRLMGFHDDFISCDDVVQAYKQAGNSMAVDVIRELIQSILKTGIKLC